MTELELHFIDRPPILLQKTVFKHKKTRITTDRSSEKETPIPWRGGVRAYMCAFVTWAGWARQPEGDRGAEPPGIPSGKGEMASSVQATLARHLAWRAQMFGDLSFTRLIYVSREHNRPRIFLTSNLLNPADIRVFIDGQQIEDPQQLEGLAADIARQKDVPRVRPHDPPHEIPSTHPGTLPTTLLPPTFLSNLDEQECQELVDLAAVSLQLAPNRLDRVVGMILGRARRVQMLVEFRTYLERANHGLRTLISEIQKEPANVQQTLRNVTQLQNQFTDSTMLLRDQASHWPRFRELAEAAAKDLGLLWRQTIDNLKGNLVTEPVPVVDQIEALKQVGETAEQTRKTFVDHREQLTALLQEALTDFDDLELNGGAAPSSRKKSRA